MPPLARLYVKTALAYLAFALAAGMMLSMSRGALSAALGAVWIHLLVVGWLTQLIFGVAYWLFPRYSRERPYGNSRLAWAAYGLLNVGLAGRVVAEPATLLALGAIWGPVLVASAGAQALGAISFVYYIWPRVRAR
jgi:hypothetical protein